MTTPNGYIPGGPSHLPGPSTDRPEWRAARMPEFPDYPDLQPPAYYERFYREELVVRVVGDRVELSGTPPQYLAIALEVVARSRPDALDSRSTPGILRIAGKVDYRVVGYHVKHHALLLERVA